MYLRTEKERLSSPTLPSLFLQKNHLDFIFDFFHPEKERERERKQQQRVT